jgi:glutathione S-transferase
MKLYTFPGAPNPRRVHMYLLERGIEIDLETVDIMSRANRTPEFLEQKNVMGGLPVLALDDGTHIAESVAICRYLEATQPGPLLFGETPVDKAMVDMWLRRLELNFMMQVGMVWIHGSPLTKAVNPNQITEVADSARKAVGRYFEFLDTHLKDHDFITGDAFSMADIVALTTLEFGKDLNQLDYASDLKALANWHESVGQRPSAQQSKRSI